MSNFRLSEEDAYLVSIRGWAYFYAIEADLNEQGSHYYKQNKKTKEVIEVSESDIIDIVQNRKSEILHLCPCVQIENGHLKPLVVRGE